MRQDSIDGFSLVEMLVVLVIAALVIAAIANYPYGLMRPSSPKVLARQIAVFAAALEAKAVAQTVPQSITVDISARKITFGDAQIDIPQSFEITMKTGAELISQGMRGAIELSPDGTSSGGEIALKDQEGNSATVQINWITGAITLGEPK